MQGRRSADFMGITEEEEEEDEEDVELVDDFSAALMKPGEYVEEASQPDGVEKPLPSQRGGLGLS